MDFKINKIKKLRKYIEGVDSKIVLLLEKRFKLAQQILKEKINLNLPLTDVNREKEIIKFLETKLKNKNLKDLIEGIYNLIFEFGKKDAVFNKLKEPSFQKIGILGCGLIGGSIIKTLKSKNKNILIFTLKKAGDKDINLAFKQGYIDRVYDNLNNFLNEIEILILATPIEAVIDLAKNIKKEKIKNKLIIIDVASIKEKIVKSFEKLTNKNFEFLGTHPMAGSNKMGFENSNSFLFINYPWIITPHKKNKKETIKKVLNLIEFLGSKPIILKAFEHDQKVALASHLVFILSTLLFDFVNQDKAALKLAGTGFWSTTRLVSGNPLMYSQIFNNNYKNIKKALNLFLKFATKNFPSQEKSLDFFIKNKKNRDNYLKKFNEFK